ncbi:phosphate ABC transporter ATP-binding protein [candidate division WOR-3 bacterium]|uniref:Phosphate ABC transporter ATP-binding protein n=1 Tax=candidate division WOR-3 bacterium TaxID=2052148 RepID=A0A660SJ18_UNCW3|nr:MAG: phosphate ABC transporter ATP-binding protein [candidate division WOR-3 bacterium]
MVKDKITIINLNFWYGKKLVLKNINFSIPAKMITAIMGPSGCGKSTLLRCLNRMNDLIDGARLTGKVIIDGQDIYARSVDVYELRKKVGMVFQKPNPFPKSIFENVAYGLKIHGLRDKNMLYTKVEQALRDAHLYDEVKERLHGPALELSGGQQQRLCIARAIAVKPDILLFDEPCASLDPIATAKIEKLLEVLKKDYTIVIVTHNLQQAARVADYTAFLMLGELVEFGPTDRIFKSPRDQRTENYLTGRIG